MEYIALVSRRISNFKFKQKYSKAAEGRSDERPSAAKFSNIIQEALFDKKYNIFKPIQTYRSKAGVLGIEEARFEYFANGLF